MMAQLWGHLPTEPRRQGMERLTRHESCKKGSRTGKQRPVNSWHRGTTFHYPCVRPWVLSMFSPVRLRFLLIATQKVFPDLLPKWSFKLCSWYSPEGAKHLGLCGLMALSLFGFCATPPNLLHPVFLCYPEFISFVQDLRSLQMRRMEGIVSISILQSKVSFYVTHLK